MGFAAPVEEPSSRNARIGVSPSSATPFVTRPNLRPEDLRSAPRRRVRVPIVLFLLTCFSTFWVGVNHWSLISPAIGPFDAATAWRWTVYAHWDQGLTYMLAILAILLAHEMGHFVLTLIHRIPASLPYFIPVPFLSPIGTMGAVIGMAASRANRKQIFDIGIAGPIAGLVIAIPVLILGIMRLDVTLAPRGGIAYDCPLLVRILFHWLRPDLVGIDKVWVNQLNANYMAAWVGLLVTGLNMTPLSQLDGGHVIYALLTRRAHLVARVFLLLIMAYMVIFHEYMWLVMTILVTLIGVDHPPTSNDDVPLGAGRIALGWLSLLIPVLCFPPRGMIVYF